MTNATNFYVFARPSCLATKKQRGPRLTLSLRDFIELVQPQKIGSYTQYSDSPLKTVKALYRAALPLTNQVE